MPQPYELHVSPSGDDAADGTQGRPLRTPTAAALRVRAQAGGRPATVWFADGTYPLAEPWCLGMADSGSADCPRVYAALPGASPVFSGVETWAARWTEVGDGLWRTLAPAGGAFDGLVIDGRVMRPASYPKRGWSNDALAPERIARWRDPTGGYVHALHEALWGGMHFRITGRRDDGTLAWEGGWQNNRGMAMNRQFLRVEGIVEELTESGEWCLDRAAGHLLLRPEPHVDLRHAATGLVRLRHLIELDGVSQVEFRGLTLRHTARTFMETREPLLRSDWTIYRGGAVVLRRTTGCRLADCTIEQCGGNGVVLDGRNREARLSGCLLRDLGASGVVMVGAAGSDRMRQPDGHLWMHPDLADRTPGPQGEDFPEHCVVEDCLIQRIGLIEKQSAGVQISRSRRITVRQCTVHDVPRAGINISEGTFGGHLIEGCDVFATVLETSDHGAFNSWGRDRFWAQHIPTMQAQVDAEPGLPFLDAALTTVLRRNRWRCDHGWDIDLDDGSGNYLIEGNVCLHGGIKLREGWGRTVLNNLLIGCTVHPHVWPERSGDVVQRNVVMRSYAPIGMPSAWGASWDGNLLPDDATLAASRVAGRDLHSLAGDPGFINAEVGDFRLRPDSPARDLGWQDIPMDDFGVRSPRLRALAGHVELPTAIIAQVVGHPAPSVRWLGAHVRSVSTMGEMSAAALSRIGGVLVTGVPSGCPAAAAGLSTMDVIIAINGEEWPDADQLLATALPAELLVRRFSTNRRVVIPAQA